MERSITDSTDFLKTRIPHLAQLDTLLRCHICKDFLKIPVLTPCGHTFCSLCIREYINNSAKCPLCLTELRESMLRSEFLVNEITECYTNLRPSLLECLQKVKEKNVVTELVNDSSLIEIDSDPDIEMGESQTVSNDDIQIVGSHEASNKFPSSPKKISKPNGAVNKKSRSTVESMFSKTSKTVKSPTQQLAQCPICQEFFPLRVLERSHLDECLNLQSLGKLPKRSKPTIIKSKSTLSSSMKKVSNSTTDTRFQSSNRSKSSSSSSHSSNSPSPQPKDDISYVSKYLSSSSNTQKEERLPKLDHTTLSMTQLRQKLANLGLPSAGSRKNLIDRYSHYEIIWNSNFCDSLSPIDVSDLKRQLASWEASHAPITGTGRNTIGDLMKRGDKGYQKLMSNFRNDKFERRSWIELYSKEFKKLIKEAKKTYTKANKRSDSNNEGVDISTKANGREPEILRDEKVITEVTSTQLDNPTAVAELDIKCEDESNTEHHATSDDELSRDLSQHMTKNSKQDN
ncbi:postreplication repair E3 ubiquitin-protein ligase Rad18p [Monosporozyma unispora]|nr:E3 ubiquitin-protein ligase rad18 [Kazachstania unispora]